MVLSRGILWIQTLSSTSHEHDFDGHTASPPDENVLLPGTPALSGLNTRGDGNGRGFISCSVIRSVPDWLAGSLGTPLSIQLHRMNLTASHEYPIVIMDWRLMSFSELYIVGSSLRRVRKSPICRAARLPRQRIPILGKILHMLVSVSGTSSIVWSPQCQSTLSFGLSVVVKGCRASAPNLVIWKAMTEDEHKSDGLCWFVAHFAVFHKSSLLSFTPAQHHSARSST